MGEVSLKKSSKAPSLTISFLLCVLLSSHASLGAEVYQKERAEFRVDDRTLKGYRVKARATYPYPVSAVLDASHDHLHLSEIDQDIKREDVTHADCAQDICRINVHVLVGSFFGVGKITYDLDTQIQEQEDGSIIIEWTKTTGTRFIKHLRGFLELTPRSTEEQGTAVDYHFEIVGARRRFSCHRRSATRSLWDGRCFLLRRHNCYRSRYSLANCAPAQVFRLEALFQRLNRTLTAINFPLR